MGLATYTNPVGKGVEMGDPFVLRHGGEYSLYGTTAPDGFRAWRSRDLVNWEALGYVFQRSRDSWGAKSFWAPEVVHYRGAFYMVYSVAPADGSFRICLARSESPAGPFADLHAPLFDNGWSCIDGDLFVDDDGAPYLFFDKVGAVGKPSKTEATGYMYGIIHGARLSEDLSRLEGEPVQCVQADQPWEKPLSNWSRCNEGAFVFKHEGVYYLTYSAGHYADPDYGIGYATAERPLGPWAKSPNNPLVARDLSRGVSGPGHNNVVLSPDGSERFIVYHAHADPAKPGGRRVVCIDRLRITGRGVLTVDGPTTTPQPVPA